MYMGDRWSFPKQGSAASYVWQPVQLDTGKVFLPNYMESWKPTETAIGFEKSVSKTFSLLQNKIHFKEGNWKFDNGLQSNEKNACLTFHFNGGKVGIKARTNNLSGYAKVSILDNKQKVIISSIVDCYSKVETSSQVFVSPVLKKGKYTLKIQVLGEHCLWTDKSKTMYGSKDNFVIVKEIYVL